jgi:cephalosporin hydroxylase
MKVLRPLLTLVLLAVLVAASVLIGVSLAFHHGYLDSYVKERTQRLAQDSQNGPVENHWYGVPIWQFPEDLQLYQEIIYETKPDVIIETGTFHGGLTLYLASILDAVNPDGKILTVDLDLKPMKQDYKDVNFKGKERLMGRIVAFEGSSTASEVIQGMAKHIKPGDKVLVILDSAHTKEHVAKELELYSPFVTPGNYLIVNDTYLSLYAPGWDQAGAMPAMREFLAKNPKFVIDESRNRFVISTAPDGFLKRVE